MSDVLGLVAGDLLGFLLLISRRCTAADGTERMPAASSSASGVACEISRSHVGSAEARLALAALQVAADQEEEDDGARGR